MKNLKNKNHTIFKKFLCSTFVTIFTTFGSVNITSFASSEPPPYAPTSFVGEVGNGISKAIQQIAKYYFGQKDSQITIDNVTKEVSEQITETMNHIINITYPVGSIYMSVNDVNPATIFGGVWERWGAGRVPVGVNATQSEFSSVEQTGGEKAHTLTVSEMPAHSHRASWNGDFYAFGGSHPGILRDTYGFQTSFSNIETSSTGSGSSHNNLQPYITCYMWKRIA